MGKKGAGVNNGGRKLKSINDSAGNVIVVSKSSIDGAVDDTIIGEDGKPSMDVLGGLNKDERNVIMDVIMALCGKFLAATSDNVYSPKADNSFGKEQPADIGSIPSPDTTIIQSVSIPKPVSYAGAVGATSVPKMGKANFRPFEYENLCDGVDLTIPIKFVE
ncbi:hypothetical protein Tco_0599577 [Tanacetum coccineum]